MAELNYFDPPDPGANWAPGIEDRRRKDLADWASGRYLDPTPFTHPVTGNLPPGTYMSSDIPPIDPRVANSPMSRSLGTKEQIQQADLDWLYQDLQRRKQAAITPRTADWGEPDLPIRRKK